MKKLFVLAGFMSAAAISFAQYDNTFNYSGFTTALSGSGIQSGNTISRLLSDDITVDPKWIGTSIRRIEWTVANRNAVDVSARMRARVHLQDGASGGPGTLYSGVTYGATTFLAGTGYSWYSDFAVGFLPVLPSNKIWWGWQWDDNVGATGATAAQLDDLAQFTYDPPIVGSSPDNIFSATTAGNGFVANLPGTQANFGGTPKANVYLAIRCGTMVDGTLTLEGYPTTRYLNEVLSYKVYNSSDVEVDAGVFTFFNDGVDGHMVLFTTANTFGCKILVKGRVWLSKNLGALDLSADVVAGSGPIATLLTGDVDGDDVVSVFDYIQLSDAFDAVADLDADPNTVDPSPNWNINADLDGDDVISVFDYILLSANFDVAGDTVP